MLGLKDAVPVAGLHSALTFPEIFFGYTLPGLIDLRNFANVMSAAADCC